MADPFLGEITMFGGNFAPRGWAFCDGTLLPISSNTALFSLLGTTYGGDGRTTFALPDLRGRVAMHAGSGAGPGLTSRRLGERGGTTEETLSLAQIGSHSHSAVLRANTGVPDTSNPAGHVLASVNGYTSNAADADMNADTLELAATGAGQPHTNLMPYQSVSFIIALIGTFPSRN
jgi:microcystin-dependent protein